MTTTVKLYSWSYRQSKTYLTATLFVLGNLVLPQLAHLIPQGGASLLPIYFFTLIASYKYGWRVGVLTAILSPTANNLLFGMPPLPVFPAILIKSLLLALLAAGTAASYKRLSLPILMGVVLGSQLIGTLIEWIMLNDLFLAVQNFRVGIPGILLQIFGGYFVIRYLPI